MSVPSHNLYDYIHQVLERKFWLLYFFCWGDKSISNLVDYIKDSTDLDNVNGIPVENRIGTKILPPEHHDISWIKCLQPMLLCHDQEPLNFELYSDGSDHVKKISSDLLQWGIHIHPDNKNLNLRYKDPSSWQKYWILLHSEIDSDELEKYESTGKFIGAYWWSHAIIARDWYRYAEHDPSLNICCPKKKLFLIYCRDTTGSRSYRGNFLSRLDDSIRQHCQIGSFSQTEITSDHSAVYVSEDFVFSTISVVLETVFEDSRIHLTEKILRPIACGHPFILAAGPGSLSLLKKYGFKTFSPWIDESYDDIKDPTKRIEKLVQEMERILSLTEKELTILVKECQDIADYNKTRFFSKDFFEQIVSELKTNVLSAQIKTKNQFDTSPWILNYIYKRRNLEEINFPPGIEKLLEQYQSHQYCLNDKPSTNSDDV